MFMLHSEFNKVDMMMMIYVTYGGQVMGTQYGVSTTRLLCD